MPLSAGFLTSERFYYIKLTTGGRCCVANTLFGRHFSFLHENVGDIDTAECIIPEDRHLFEKVISQCCTNPLVKRSATLRMQKQDKSAFSTEWEFSASVDDNGDFNGVEAIGLPQQTVAMPGTQNFDTQLQSLKLLSDCSTDGILLLGRNYRILAYNKPAERQSAELYNREYERGDDFRGYIRPEAEQHFHRQFDGALRGNTTEEIFELVKDQEKLFLKVQMTPVYNDNNDVTAVAIVTKDFTTVQNLNNRINEITAMQSHQARRPVANMLSLVSLIENDNLTAEQREYLHLLKISIAQLEEEIHGIVKKQEIADIFLNCAWQ